MRLIRPQSPSLTMDAIYNDVKNVMNREEKMPTILIIISETIIFR